MEEKEQLIETMDVKDTPFTVIRKDDKYAVCMGQNRLSAWFESEEEAYADCKDVSWDRLLNVIMLCIKHSKEILERKEKEDDLLRN